MHLFILEPPSYSACREQCCFYLAMLEENLWGPEGEENDTELANKSGLGRQPHPVLNSRFSIHRAV